MKFDILTVLNTTLGMFIVMMVGYFLRKKDTIDAQFSKKLSKLVLHVTQPVLIVSSMIKLDMNEKNNINLGILLLISLGVHISASVLGYLSMRFMKPQNARKLSEHSIIFANVMFFGLPIVKNLFSGEGSAVSPDEAQAWASFFSIIFHVFAWTYGMIILGRGRDDIKLNPKKIIFNYGTIPCAIGALLYFIKFKSIIESCELTGVISALEYIGGLCTPVSLLVLGGVLSTYPIKKLLLDPKVYYVCFVKLIVFPLAVFFAVWATGLLSDEMLMFTLVMSALPTASLTNMFAELHDIEPGYAATCVGMTTAVSVVTLPVVVYIGQMVLGV